MLCCTLQQVPAGCCGTLPPLKVAASAMCCCAALQVGSFRDPEAVREFAKGCDVLTVEIEHIDADAMQASLEGCTALMCTRLFVSTASGCRSSWTADLAVAVVGSRTAAAIRC